MGTLIHSYKCGFWKWSLLPKFPLWLSLYIEYVVLKISYLYMFVFSFLRLISCELLLSPPLTRISSYNLHTMRRRQLMLSWYMRRYISFFYYYIFIHLSWLSWSSAVAVVLQPKEMVLVEVCIDDGEKLHKTISGIVFFIQGIVNSNVVKRNG